MKSTRILLLCVVLAVIAGCSGGGGGSSSSAPAAPFTPTISLPNGLTLPPVTGNNVLTITVDGSECSAASVAAWPNKPCVSVTICDPSNAHCQSVNDILLDTGDYGVRIFQQALPSNLLTALTPMESGSLPVYECVEYGDGSKVWGPVQVANVWLTGLTGGEKAQVPIQVIGSTTPDLISGSRHACSGAWSSPTTAYYNGSLGLGLFVQDCGETCAPPHTQNGNYFTCSGGTCTGTAVPVASQVQNPVASLPVDNNGVGLLLPSVPSGGSPSATGYLVLGIGTQSNNSPSGVVAYGANSSGNFTTAFNGASYESFIDSGSNGLFFPDSAIQTCGDWYCPPSTAHPIGHDYGLRRFPERHSRLPDRELQHPHRLFEQRILRHRRADAVAAVRSLRLGVPLLPWKKRVCRHRGNYIHPGHGAVLGLLREEGDRLCFISRAPSTAGPRPWPSRPAPPKARLSKSPPRRQSPRPYPFCHAAALRRG